MQTTVIREKVDKTIEETRALQEKAKRLREVFRKIDIGDRVKIIWILDNLKFENQFAKEKMRGWLEGRESIIKYGKTTAEIPTYPVRKTSKKSKWKPEKFSLRGEVRGKVGKNLWKVEVSIGAKDCTGIFSGKEFVFIEHSHQ
ncbi:MAG: hypothetical protein PHX30_05670 [Candidatus Pacebacteria bacterium]|nr:hypothetical protein [Candidatus Paceibacterota bacterium]